VTPVGEVLRKALALIEERGWDPLDYDGHSIYGAISRALRPDEEPGAIECFHPLFDPACNLIEVGIERSDIWAWESERGRTREQVVTALRWAVQRSEDPGVAR